VRFNELPSKIKKKNITRHFIDITHSETLHLNLLQKKTWRSIQKLQMKKTNLFSQRGNNLKHKENTNQVH
jgi:hypothetical protein